MQPFDIVRGPAAPLLLPDINTDVIAPAHSRRGDLAANAFAPLRYLADGGDHPGFVLNQDRFRDAPILLAGPNFGCGSSRESAVWALCGLGIRCVVAESFGDIFYGNCFQNGVLPVVLDHVTLGELATEAETGEDFEVDLRARTIMTPGGRRIAFEVDAMHRSQLLEGLDDLDVGVRRREAVRAFQARDIQRRPWVYAALSSSGMPPSAGSEP